MITIHMTTHKRLAAGLLDQAVSSVLTQDFQDFEFIVCDDASTDGTAAYLDAVAATDKRLKVFRNPRNVNSVAISLGRCMTASDPGRRWVSWMFDDCILLPGALRKLAAAVAGRDLGMIYGITEVRQPDGSAFRVGDLGPDEVRARIAASSVLVPNGGILIDRKVFDRIGWYDPSIVLRRSCDWDLFRRIIDAGTAFEVLPDVLMEEHGALQADSLRNAFTTTFDLMARFIAARDASGLRISLANTASMPIDWIPPAAWTPQDLGLMQFMFVEYFLSVGDLPRAFRWARSLEAHLPGGNLLRQNLLRSVSEGGNNGAMAAGAYAGIMLGAFRQHRERLGEA